MSLIIQKNAFSKRARPPEDGQECERPAKRHCPIEEGSDIEDFEMATTVNFAHNKPLLNQETVKKLNDLKDIHLSEFSKKITELSMQCPAIFSLPYLRTLPTFDKNHIAIKYKLIAGQLGFTGEILLSRNLFKDLNCDLEGFRQTYMLSSLKDTFLRFSSSREDLIDTQSRHIIYESFSRALWCDNFSDTNVQKTCSLIQDPTYHYPILAELGWSRHSIQAIFLRIQTLEKSVLHLFHVNRGDGSGEKPGIVILKVKNEKAITPDFLKSLLNSLSLDQTSYKNLNKIKTEINADEIAYVKMKSQDTGNCVYASLKGALRALLLISKCTNGFREGATFNDPILQKHKDAAKLSYQMFSEYEARESIEDLCQDYDEFNPELFSAEDQCHYIRLNKIANLIWRWKDSAEKPKKIGDALLATALETIEYFDDRISNSSHCWQALL